MYKALGGAGITCKYFYNQAPYANTVEKAKMDAQAVISIFMKYKDVINLEANQCTIWMDVEDKILQGLGAKLYSQYYKRIRRGYKVSRIWFWCLYGNGIL